MTHAPGEDRVERIAEHYAKSPTPFIREDVAYLVKRLREVEGEREDLRRNVAVLKSDEALRVAALRQAKEGCAHLRAGFEHERGVRAQAEQRITELAQKLEDAECKLGKAQRVNLAHQRDREQAEQRVAGVAGLEEQVEAAKEYIGIDWAVGRLREKKAALTPTQPAPKCTCDLMDPSPMSDPALCPVHRQPARRKEQG